MAILLVSFPFFFFSKRLTAIGYILYNVGHIKLTSRSQTRYFWCGTESSRPHILSLQRVLVLFTAVYVDKKETT